MYRITTIQTVQSKEKKTRSLREKEVKRAIQKKIKEKPKGRRVTFKPAFLGKSSTLVSRHYTKL